MAFARLHYRNDEKTEVFINVDHVYFMERYQDYTHVRFVVVPEKHLLNINVIETPEDILQLAGHPQI